MLSASQQGEHRADLPEQKALGIFYHGCYTNHSRCHRELSAYAAAQNLSPQARYGILILEGPPQHKDPANFILRWLLFYNDSVKQDFLHRYELKASFLQNIHYFQCCGDRSIIMIRIISPSPAFSTTLDAIQSALWEHQSRGSIFHRTGNIFSSFSKLLSQLP